MPKPLYITMPNTNYSPTGPFTLGSLLSDPKNPEALVENFIPLQIAPFIPIQQTSLSGFHDTSSKSNKAKSGIFTRFLSFLLGVDIDINYEYQNGKTNKVAAENLEASFFTPTKEYLEKVLQELPVQEFVQQSRFRANVYLVTGVRCAFGVGPGSSTEEKNHSTDVSFGVNAAQMGVPVEAGPSTGVQRERKRELAWEGSSDFVYAYRVKEVKYSPRRERIVSTKDVKGDLYAIDGKRVVKNTDEEEVGDEGIVLELDDEGAEWVTATVMRVKAEEILDDDGELCDVVIP